MQSLVERLRQSARGHGPRRAIIFQDRVTTHAEFDQLTDRVAAGLAARGIRKGDRVGLYCVNSDAFAAAYFGILKANAAVVPVNLLLNPKEISFILKDAGAKALIYFDALAPAVQQIVAPQIEFRVRIGGAADGDIPWLELLSNRDPAPAHDLAPAEDLAAILYTSGTTGFPKGAMLTHWNLVSNTESIRIALQLEPGRDVLLTVLPMFHAFAATVGMIFPLLNGCALVPISKFDPALVADAVERNSVTVLPLVPSMFNTMLRLPNESASKLASLKYAVSGGAAMPMEIMEQFERKFGKLVYEGDGPTECSPVTCVNPIGGVRKPKSVGKSVPGVEMKIMDESGRELPRDQIGEICVRGPNVMKGYWNHPEETRAAFFGEWFRTGDLGTEDEDGYFCIVDRKKDMIIVNGMNVYPRIIEELLYRHPAIREAAVVGEPDGLHGEIPMAHVSLKEGAAATPAELRAYCREHLGRHEIPRKVIIRAELPKSGAGKILKRELSKAGEIERGITSG